MLTQDPTGAIHADQTGKLPVTSCLGMQHIFVFYNYDANYIHMEPMKSRHATEILAAFQRSNDIFLKAGFSPRLHRLDNECSTVSKGISRRNK